jgi:hypothetical protein
MRDKKRKEKAANSYYDGNKTILVSNDNNTIVKTHSPNMLQLI